MSQAQQPQFELTTSRGFPSWLNSQNLAIVFTTYQAGKIFMVGIGQNGRLSVFERTLERVMGLALKGEDLYTATLWQVWRFRNSLMPGQNFQQYDRVFLPRQSWVTGDIDIHDMAVEENGRLVFANTLFNCVGTLDENHNFRAVWRPSWISRLAPEDRCHLNGIALRDGKLHYATAVSRSDVSDGWRDKRRDSGVLIDIPSNEVICEGLSMPHSPRYHDGRLYVINSGAGYFGVVEDGKFGPMTFLPGYARGMAIHGDYALIGLSDRRENRTFQDLPLEDELKKHDAETRCGIQVVNLKTGDSTDWIRIGGVVKELFDIAVIPNCRCPMIIGFRSDEVRRMISHPE